MEVSSFVRTALRCSMTFLSPFMRPPKDLRTIAPARARPPPARGTSPGNRPGLSRLQGGQGSVAGAATLAKHRVRARRAAAAAGGDAEFALQIVQRAGAGGCRLANIA